MWSAAVLGTSARNGFIAGITTAGDESSETLIDLYKQGERAANGDPELERFGFFVWTAPDGADVKDPDAILKSNPAVACGRIPLARIMSDIAIIPEHEARRYRLNQFITGTAQTWLPADVFHKAAGNGITEIEGSVLGIDITGKWEHATIAAANKNGDTLETELVASYVQPTENVLYNAIVTLYRKHKIRAIVIDGNRAPNLAKRLKLNGFVIWQLYSKEVAAACSQAYAGFQRGKIIHNNDPLLISQFSRGVVKHVGENWYISRRDSPGDVDALMATLFALYTAATREESVIGVF
jgi:phage terminase large subunit-like protein